MKWLDPSAHVTLIVISLFPVASALGGAQKTTEPQALAGLLMSGDDEHEWFHAEEPLDHHNPWGADIDGLVCRILLNDDYCDGEAIHLVLEVRNVSKENVVLPTIFDFTATNMTSLKVIDPDGKRLAIKRADAWDMPNFGPQRFWTLPPGQLLRIQFPDLRKHIESSFVKHGEYQLEYQYFGARLLGRAPAKKEVEVAWKGTLVSNKVTITRAALTPDDLTIHEWGVFSVTSNLKTANTGRKAEWESMPPFFYRQFPHWRLRWIPSAWDKPIVYFYTKRPHLQLDLQVDFPAGAPVIWWPACSSPIDDTPGRPPRPDKTGPLFQSLKWNLWLGDSFAGSAGSRPLGGYRSAQLHELPKESWLHVARNVPKAATVSTYGTKLSVGKAWWVPHVESERFVYYDGLVPTPDYLRCLASDRKRTVLKNVAKFPLNNLFVVHADGNAPVQFAHLKELPAGAERAIEFQTVERKSWPSRGIDQVQDSLRQAGLFEAEATALIKLWSDKFFNASGLTAFYLLPKSEYDRMLPVKVTPTPEGIVRVGVAHHAHLEEEPAMRRRATELIEQLDADNFRARQSASRQLVELGPAAFQILRETAKKTDSLEIKSRCLGILDKFDARVYLEQAARAARLKDGSTRKPKSLKLPSIN